MVALATFYQYDLHTESYPPKNITNIEKFIFSMGFFWKGLNWNKQKNFLVIQNIQMHN